MENTGRTGRPRSEQAREAVLRAVDDLLVEVGYAALTMKGVAERAGVGRQTVYRWWGTKAEILLEATVADAEEELAVATGPTPVDDLTGYLDALLGFLVRSPAGAGYRALLAAAQHDPAVAELMAAHEVLGHSARVVLDRVVPAGVHGTRDQTVAMVVGPVLFWVLSGRDPHTLATRELATDLLRLLSTGQPA